MAKSFKTLIEKLPIERQKEIQDGTQLLLSDMAQEELEKAFQLTQIQLAKTLDTDQETVSRIERESDMYVGTLRRFLEAMGAELKVVASFPDREIVINQFEGVLSQSTGTAVYS